jgi:cytochrome c
MKKIISTVAVVAFLIACNNAEEKKPEAAKEEKKVEEPTLANNPDYYKGVELYNRNDCATCHKVDVRLQGPSYAEVAAKYKGDTAMIKTLADRIIKGSKGVWGDIEMPAHPALSKEDAVALVKYVYLLKE